MNTTKYWDELNPTQQAEVRRIFVPAKRPPTLYRYEVSPQGQFTGTRTHLAHRMEDVSDAARDQMARRLWRSHMSQQRRERPVHLLIEIAVARDRLFEAGTDLPMRRYYQEALARAQRELEPLLMRHYKLVHLDTVQRVYGLRYKRRKSLLETKPATKVP